MRLIDRQSTYQSIVTGSNHGNVSPACATNGEGIGEEVEDDEEIEEVEEVAPGTEAGISLNLTCSADTACSPSGGAGEADACVCGGFSDRN